MTLRRDLLVSSIMLTAGLLWLVPPTVQCIRSTDSMVETAGFASLANILAGLVVVWSGLIKRSRSAWVVLLIIVWVWAFPIMVLPLLTSTLGMSLSEWVSDAWHEPGVPRIYLTNVVMFALMLIALVLPIRSIFWKQNRTDLPA